MKLNTIKIEDSHCLWNNLFDEDEISSIIKYCESVPRNEGLVGTDSKGEPEFDRNIRYSSISWIHRNAENDWFFHKIQSASNKLNSKFFGFDIEVLDTIQYTVYEGQDSHYDWHWDCFIGNSLDNINDEKQRKLSSVLQLDGPDDYDGGVLQLLPCGTIKEVERKKGLMVSFPSFLLHRVTPVKSGLRRSLVAWFTGPDWR